MEIETSVFKKSAGQQSSGRHNSLDVRFPKRPEAVLFVDDEILLTQLGTNMLQRLGYRTATCTSGTRALSMFNADPAGYDLLIADLFMPDMSGLDLCSACKNIRSGFPTIISSGQSFLDPSYLKKIERLNIEAILHKPFSYMKLASIVRAVLDKQCKKIQAS
jgi:DNA-binding NtrC family response regulator